MVYETIMPGKYTIAEIADITGFSKQEIRTAIKQGQLKAHKEGRYMLAKSDDLRPWAKKMAEEQWDNNSVIKVILPTCLYTHEEIAEALKMSKNAVYTACKSGEMVDHVVRSGRYKGAVMITGSDALEYNRKSYVKPDKILPEGRYSAREISVILGLSVTTVYGAAERGMLSGEYAYKKGAMQTVYKGQQVLDWRAHEQD